MDRKLANKIRNRKLDQAPQPKTAKSEYLVGMQVEELGLTSKNFELVVKSLDEAQCYNSV